MSELASPSPVGATTGRATPTGDATTSPDEVERAQRIFSISVVISAIRCTLTYVVLPWLAPAIGLASGVGPAIGIPVGSVAIAANIASIRRFHRARHPWRWYVSAVNLGIIGLLVVLVGGDLLELAT